MTKRGQEDMGARKKTYGLYSNVKLSDTENKKLNEYYKNADDIIQHLSEVKKTYCKKYKRDFVAALVFAHEVGIENH